MSAENIGNMIKNIRRERKLTQRQMAEILHVSSSTVSKWETGTAVPDIYMLKNIADTFDISFVQMLGEQPEEEENQKSNIPKKNRKKYFYMRIAVVGIIIFTFVLGISWSVKEKHRVFRAKVVDEYMDTTSHFSDYGTIYHVVLEYDGELTAEIALDYPDELRPQYEHYFDEADVILVSFWDEYRGREYIFESDSITFLEPIPDLGK